MSDGGVNSKATILVVDDDPGQRSLLSTFLSGQGYRVHVAESGAAGLAQLQAGSVSMIISDVRMPGMSGLEMLRRVRERDVRVPVLLVTAFANIREAVDAMRDGALNYLSKPIDLDELLSTVAHHTGTGIANEAPAGGQSLPDGIVAESPLMQSLFHDAALVAPSESRVLITGESGVGKEVLADVIHQWSARAGGPLVKINCAAIPENLLESELFGHEKGSFTGAHQQRIGRFEEANDGTIFLDEIGEMSPALQAKLLRITQDGCFRRVGSNKDLLTNARILAATNRDLEIEIENGRFREDLFYRLNVLELNIPPLRERHEDILPLATHFLAEFAQGRARMSNALIDRLQSYAWPGNVRELRNAMERAALISRGEVILPEHLPNRVRTGETRPATALAAGADSKKLEEIERDAILAALREHSFNRTETAKALAISRRALTYKLQRMRELGFAVDPPDVGA
ncbi:MAG TPA: sigma-54-dependent Fis family transcriptional regulator [Verrucomicrobiales bacterium]|nr:sigma-54-dependent Fis family transcriptional regulator [Verrucomicrobiales bacterium]